MNVKIKYQCAKCKKMTEVHRTFDIEDEVICVECFGIKHFPRLEKMGYKVEKINDGISFDRGQD